MDTSTFEGSIITQHDIVNLSLCHPLTGRSTGSSASVRSESPELSDRTLDISAYDTQKLHEYLREFTKRRRSSVYLRSVQDQMNNYFGDGQKTHLVDVTSPGRLLQWTASSEFGTYRLCVQRRFRRACASPQSRQNLRCSLIQAVSQEEPSDRKPDPWPL